MILFAIFLCNMCYIYLSIKALCDYRNYEVLREDYACELSMVGGSSQFRACFSLKHDPTVGWKEREMEDETTLLAMKTHKNLKTFLTGQVCLVIRASPSRCCKKFPLCLRDCHTVFASRQEMHLHNVLTLQATAWNRFFLENIYAMDQLFNGSFWFNIKNYSRSPVAL